MMLDRCRRAFPIYFEYEGIDMETITVMVRATVIESVIISSYRISCIDRLPRLLFPESTSRPTAMIQDTV